jgi:cobalt-zinc-cadmium efflux system protein
MADAHSHVPSRAAERSALKLALALIAVFMAAEVATGVVASSLALLSDAAHMLGDAAALAFSLVAARLATRPASGSMTYGLGRAEILSAQANGITLLLLALLIVYESIRRLASPAHVEGAVVLGVALGGIVVNVIAARVLAGRGTGRSLNVEGSYRHVLTDLLGFIATAVAGAVILATGFRRADPIASLVISAVMMYASFGLLKDSGRVFMEAAPAGLDPDEVGRVLASEPGVVEVHDLHVWEVTSGFAALSAHVVVEPEADPGERRRHLERVIDDRFRVRHTTLQVDHSVADQKPLQIEISRPGAAANPEPGVPKLDSQK